mgnify:CR=1 FL=1
MYKLKEIAEILNVSDRTVERYLKSYFSLENGAYKVSEKMLEVLKFEYLENESDMVVEEFTKEEYEEFHKRLVSGKRNEPTAKIKTSTEIKENERYFRQTLLYRTCI